MWVEPAGSGVRVTVRVRPRSRPGLAAAGGSLVVAVASAPVEGRANDEVRRALARVLGVPPSSIRLVAGAHSRTKVFEAARIGAAEAGRRIEEALDQRKQ